MKSKPFRTFGIDALRVTWSVCLALLMVSSKNFAIAQKPDAPAAEQEKQEDTSKTDEVNEQKSESTEPEKEGSEDSAAEPKEDPPLPRLDEMSVPTVEELHRQPVDWVVVLQDEQDRVLVTRRVHPRPGTLEKMLAAIEESKKWPRPTNDKEREEQKKQREDLDYLTIFLPGESEDNEYQLHINSIRQIIYHEDLIIRRAMLFMDEGKLRDAFELLFALDRDLPDWAGLAEAKNRLVFLEADAALARNDVETALNYLEELHGRDPKYPRLYTQLGVVADRLMSTARKDENYRRVRYFLRRLEAKEPKHEMAQQWRDSLLAEAREELATAASSASQGAHDIATEAADRAALVWPSTPGLPEAHRRYANRFQQLKVGVVRWAGEETPFVFPAAAEQREERLTQFRVFEVNHIDDSSHYRTPLFEQWTPTDLGRQVVFTLRQGRALWESKPTITAGTMVEDLSERLNPASSRFDERLFHFIDSVKVTSPFEFEVHFARVPVRTEPLFRFPVVAHQANSPVGDESRRQVPGPEIVSRRFERQDRNDGTVAYRRAIPQPDGLAEYHVAEVLERRYESHERALQGLVRGEISVLPGLPSWEIARLKNDDRFFVVPYAVPTSHMLQFNPKSKPFTSREFRLAIDMSIDKPRLLNGSVLRALRTDTNDMLVTAPYSRRSPAYNTLVRKRPYDLTVALALTLAAKKSLGGQIPPLKMICTPDVVAEAVCREMIADWKRIGIPVELITSANGPVEDWDIAYRTIRMEDPLAELPSLLALEDPPRIESLKYLPDWLRKELIDLENAGDWNTAISLVHGLHQHLYAEVHYVPLWEIQDHIVIRKNIRGFPPQPIHPYQDVERWIVQSWYSTEEPGESGLRSTLTQR